MRESSTASSRSLARIRKYPPTASFDSVKGHVRNPAAAFAGKDLAGFFERLAGNEMPLLAQVLDLVHVLFDHFLHLLGRKRRFRNAAAQQIHKGFRRCVCHKRVVLFVRLPFTCSLNGTTENGQAATFFCSTALNRRHNRDRLIRL